MGKLWVAVVILEVDLDKTLSYCWNIQKREIRDLKKNAMAPSGTIKSEYHAHDRGAPYSLT